MTKQQQAALDRARKHAAALAANLKDARDAHADGDDAGVRRCHRAAAASCEALDSAHDSLERSLVEPDDYIEPTHDTSGQGGAQVSNGREPRSLDPEIRRQQDQLRSCELAYERRVRELRGLR